MTKGKFLIRNIDTEVWVEFQMLCLREGISANQMLLELIAEAVDRAKVSKEKAR